MSQRIEDMEPDLEELLLRLVPDLAVHWEGATEAQIEELERIAGQQLPNFYLWFLSRMGQSMGPLSYRSLDFSASRVLSSYADGLFLPNSRFLMIGHESDESTNLHVCYDFQRRARDDAAVIVAEGIGCPIYQQFETFREMIAWQKFLTHRVKSLPQRCGGIFEADEGDVLSKLDPVMESLGFSEPVSTGPCCGLYDSEDAAMVSMRTPGRAPEFQYFDLGGRDHAGLRRILGAISDSTSLAIEVREWDPRLTTI